MRQSIFPDDANLALFQQAIQDQFSQVSKIPFLNGNAVNSVAVSGTTTVDHGLGRAAQGYFITSLTSNVIIWNDSFSGITSIVLHCSSGTATVSLWVY